MFFTHFATNVISFVIGVVKSNISLSKYQLSNSYPVLVGSSGLVAVSDFFIVWVFIKLPPLLSNQGYAWMALLDNRFKLNDIIGKSYIIHDCPDDFHTQPSGNSGTRIACGVIQRP